MSVKIVVDSSADLAKRIRDQFTVVPLSIFFDGEEYIDGVTILHEEFYQKLVECDTLPTTSQASPGQFMEAFQSLVDEGHDVVCITVSGKLSGTAQSASIAAQDFPGRVFVVDSNTIAIGSGILAEYALGLAEKGLSALEIAVAVERERENVRLIAMVDTLEYLQKGGRLSKAAAIAGGILSIKPVLAIEEGVIKILGKARGSKQGNNLLVQKINEAGGVDFEKPVLLGYTGLTDVYLKKYIKDSSYLWEDKKDDLEYELIGSVVGTHAGPGAIAAAFFAKE
ncbi:MAG: DegV family protein [Firmicutes bacterium]|nr:DegV family protein [Bacillota bacterium]